MTKSKKPRDYQKEYARDHSSPSDIANRAARNKARKESILKPGDPREIDHKKPLMKGGSNSKTNTQILTRKDNRKKGSK